MGLWRDLVDDLVAVAPGVPDEGLFLRAVVLPGPAAGVPVVGPAHPGGVDDGYPLGVGDVDQLPDARHAVPGLGAARVAPALDRLQNRLPAVAAEAVVHVDDEQGRPLAEPRPGAVSGRGEHRLVTLGQELIPDGLGHDGPPWGVSVAGHSTSKRCRCGAGVPGLAPRARWAAGVDAGGRARLRGPGKRSARTK